VAIHAFTKGFGGETNVLGWALLALKLIDEVAGFTCVMAWNIVGFRGRRTGEGCGWQVDGTSFARFFVAGVRAPG